MWRKLVHLLAFSLVVSSAGCFLDTDDDDDDDTDGAAVVEESDTDVDVKVTEMKSAVPSAASSNAAVTAGAAAPAYEAPR